MLDEVRTRLNHHEEVAILERASRRRARRRGEAVSSLAPGQSFGLLTRANVRELRRVLDQTTARAKRLPGYRARLRALK